MRTKGKAKIRVNDNVNVASNDRGCATNADACVSTGVHMHDTTVQGVCDFRQPVYLPSQLKRKACATSLVSERQSSKRLAYESCHDSATDDRQMEVAEHCVQTVLAEGKSKIQVGGMDVHDTTGVGICDVRDPICLAPQLKRKVPDSFVARETQSFKKLADETCERGPSDDTHTRAAECGAKRSLTDDHQMVVAATYSGELNVTQGAFCRGPVVLDFTSGTISPQTLDNFRGPTCVAESKGETPTNGCLRCSPQGNTPSKRRRRELRTSAPRLTGGVDTCGDVLEGSMGVTLLENLALANR